MPTTTPAESAPLYEIKANLFKALAHPVRIRLLEVIVAAPEQRCLVSELLDETELEASLLSQHLAVLKRNGVVRSTRRGNAVEYETAHPGIASLLAVARTFLIDSLTDQSARLEAARLLPPPGGAG